MTDCVESGRRATSYRWRIRERSVYRRARGVPRYRSDLGYPAFRIGGEYDGVSHLDRQRMRQDRERQNWLSAHGWTMRYFTDIDIYRRPHYVVSAMREALRRAGDSRPNPPI